MTERSLADWLAYLERLHPSTIDMGLERVRQVAVQAGLGRPARRVVTVTGTNGKGSTCALLAALLRQAGLRVGVYSSPHLLRYNERVDIDGQWVGDQALCEAFVAVERARGEVSLTYFEMGTLAALWLFERAMLDVVILEVGLGGRLDAVNLVDTDLAIITSIGLDHAEWLGDTRESVAFEKAGIFRRGQPAICGDPAPPVVLGEQAQAVGVAPWLAFGVDYGYLRSEGGWSWRGRGKDGLSVSLSALPPLQLPLENASIALQALYLLVDQPVAESVVKGLLAARIVGRLDRRRIVWRGRSVSLLLDVGHNPHAAQYLAGRLAESGFRGKRRAVFGLLADKDLEGVLGPLLPWVHEWAVTTLDSPRARPAKALAQALEAQGAQGQSFASVAEALEAVCESSSVDDEILVFGSFYCVAEALAWLERCVGETTDGVVG